jgi:4-amino-4-deoxy-L-arabinose transferase-like glycosyltransferase
MFNKISISTIILAIIFCLALLLRFYKLPDFPVGFHIDEASLGYNAYSFLKTGKDEHGHILPISIDMFGDNRPAGYHYLTIIPVAIFGLNEFATRFSGALFGSVTIFALYYLVLTLFKDKKIALLSAFLLSVTPWHIELSRASAETIVALFFVITGFTYIFKGLFEAKIRNLLIGTLLLFISFFFYHTPRIFVPSFYLFLIALYFHKWKTSNIKYKTILISSFLSLSAIALLLVFVVSGGTGRLRQVSIFSFPETKLVLEEQYREDGTLKVPLIITRIVHNKLVNYSLTYISNYFDYFTGQFLFIKGGNPSWYKIPNMGLLYLIELPFLLFGLIYIFNNKKLEWKIPVFWLIFAPMTAAFTYDDIPNIQRAIVLFPMFEIIIAVGIINFVNFQKKFKYYYIFITSLLLLINFLYFSHQYFVQARSHLTLYRFNGFNTMVRTIMKSYNSYSKIIITKTLGGIYPHVLFYSNYDPKTYQTEGSPKDPDFGGFGNFVFTPQMCPSITGGLKYPTDGPVIYVDNGNCEIQKNKLKHEEIYREDGTRAFIIVYSK